MVACQPVDQSHESQAWEDFFEALPALLAASVRLPAKLQQLATDKKESQEGSTSSSSEGAHYLFDATLTVVHAKDVEAWFHVYSQGVVGSLTLLHSHPMLMV